MKKTFTILSILCLLVLQFSCSKDSQAEILECSFIGTFNQEPFDFLENDLGFAVGTDNATGDMDYDISSGFGPRWASGDGIIFRFSFDEKPSSEMIQGLKAHNFLDTSIVFPHVSIVLAKEGNQYYPDIKSNAENVFEIEEITSTGEDYDFNSPSGEFVTGELFKVKGRIKIVENEIVVEGEFNLKLSELK